MAAVTCPECGASVPDHHDYCGKCGFRVFDDEDEVELDGAEPETGDESVDYNPFPWLTSKLTLAGAAVLVAFIVFLEVSRGQTAHEETTRASTLVGSFEQWVPLDDSHGYAMFTVTNTGTTSQTPECFVTVANDFGETGSDILTGAAPVAPGQTVALTIALSMEKGAFLVTGGNVNFC